MVDLARSHRMRPAPHPRDDELRAETRPGSGVPRAGRRGARRRRATSPWTPTPTCPARPRSSALLPELVVRRRHRRPCWSGSSDPASRERIAHEMEHVGTDGCHGCHRPTGTRSRSAASASPALAGLVGQTVAEIASDRAAVPARRSTSTCWSRIELATTILQHVGRRGQRAHDHAAPGALRRSRRDSRRRPAAPPGLGHLPALPGHYVRELGFSPSPTASRHLTGRPAARLRLRRPRVGARRVRRRPGALRPRRPSVTPPPSSDPASRRRESTRSWSTATRSSRAAPTRDAAPGRALRLDKEGSAVS